MYVLKGGAPGAEKEATPEELKQSEDAALALLSKANLGGPGPGSKKGEAEERRQQLLAEHAKDNRPRRKLTSRKLLEALESKRSDATS